MGSRKSDNQKEKKDDEESKKDLDVPFKAIDISNDADISKIERVPSRGKKGKILIKTNSQNQQY